MDELKAIIDAIKDRAPGVLWFTVDKNTLARIRWNPAVDPPIEKLIGDEVGGLVQYDEYGNPQFQLYPEPCRARTRGEIKRLLEYELRMCGPVIFADGLEQRVGRVLGGIMAAIEKEGY